MSSSGFLISEVLGFSRVGSSIEGFSTAIEGLVISTPLSVVLTVGLLIFTEPDLTFGFKVLRSRAETVGRAAQRAAHKAIIVLFMV